MNGVGLEITLKTFSDNRLCELCQPILFGSKQLVKATAKLNQINDLNISYYQSIEEVKGKQAAVLDLIQDEVEIEPGKSTKEAGRIAFKSLKLAAEALLNNQIDALVTAPINKKNIQSKEFEFPGHTEYVQALDGADQSLMLMLNEQNAIGVVTSHIPLSEVKKKLTSDLILSKITIFNKALKEDFGIRHPKIAVLGLNPHAGDQGLLGNEEEEIISPSIHQAKTIEILAFGPYPADGFFASGNYRNFDGVLAMYHDQGLIPAKMLSNGLGVNYTAGLSFVRTSPDHGTAYEIASRGIAGQDSFRNAIYRAIDAVKMRRLNHELEANALSKNKSRN